MKRLWPLTDGERTSFTPACKYVLEIADRAKYCAISVRLFRQQETRVLPAWRLFERSRLGLVEAIRDNHRLSESSESFCLGRPKQCV